MEALGSEIDEQLATTDCEDLLSLPVLQVENIKDNLLQVNAKKEEPYL